MKKIAVDAMGGDFAPLEIVLGAIQAVKEYKVPVVLVGDEAQIRPILEKHHEDQDPLIEIHHASEVIEMGEHPGRVRGSRGSRIDRGSRDGRASRYRPYQGYRASSHPDADPKPEGRLYVPDRLWRERAAEAGDVYPECTSGLYLCDEGRRHPAAEDRTSQYRGRSDEGQSPRDGGE